MSACLWNYVLYRQMSSILVGLCLGITVSLIVTPFLEEECGLDGYSIQWPPNLLNGISADDYEPRIQKQNKPKRKHKETKKLIRPRFYSSELGIRENLFVGVLSSSETINTLGEAVNLTLNHRLDKLVFYVDSTTFSTKKNNVVGFSDDRPLLKPFHVFKHIGENYLKDYDFFFFAPDSTYIDGVALKELTEKMSVSSRLYMGRRTEDGTGIYCSFSPGILLSRSVLLSVLDQLNWCTKNAFSDSIEDNIGRCILHSTNIPCMEKYEDKIFYSYDLEDVNLKSEMQTLLNEPMFNLSLTISSVPSSEGIYQLHRVFSQLQIVKTKQTIIEIEMNIVSSIDKEPKNKDRRVWPVSVPSPVKVDSRFDVIRWDYFTMDHIYMKTDFSVIDDLNGIDWMDVMDTFNESLGYIKDKYGKRFELRWLVNGYRRFDPIRGMEYILDIAFRDKQSGLEVHKRIEAVRPLGKVEILPIPYVTENTHITLILFVDFGNHKRVAKFLEDHARVCLKNQGNTVLVVVFIYDQRTISARFQTDLFKQLKNSLTVYTTKFQSRGPRIISLNIKMSSVVTSQIGILDLIVKKFPLTTLFLICSPDMEIKLEYLNRVRMNTIQGWQIYAPIPFIQYNPNIVYKNKQIPPTIEINRNYGHFDNHNYEYLSFYGSDFIKGRRVVENEIPIVKSEKDLNSEKHERLSYGLYNLFLKTKLFHIMRSAEPGLSIRYTYRKCEPTVNEEAYQDCVTSRAEALASRTHLAELIFERDNKLKTKTGKTYQPNKNSLQR